MNLRTTSLLLLALPLFACGGGQSFKAGGAGGSGAAASTGGSGGSTCVDADGDGYTTCQLDCDDTNAEVHPGHAEVCGDGLDNDCDGDSDPPALCGSGGADAGPPCEDKDLDGVTTCEGDCDDANPDAYTGNIEICGDSVDNDCDGDADPPATCAPTGSGGSGGGGGAGGAGGVTCSPLGTFVSALTGDDSNCGTKTDPVATIAKGIANAVAIGNGQPVFVAEGTYPEDVQLTEGVSLLGGYECAAAACSWARDPTQYDSIIRAQNHNGLMVGSTVTSKTLVEGFLIIGLSTAQQDITTQAVLVTSGTPKLRNNRMVGGSVVGCSGVWACGSVGLSITGTPNDPAGVLVEGNTILAGDSAGTSVGVNLAKPAVAVLEGNTVKSGTGNWSRALSLFGSPGTVVHDNDVFAGTQLQTNGSAFGMFVTGELTIDGNRVNTDARETGSCPYSTTFWCGGIEAEGVKGPFTNNVIYGMSAQKSVGLLFGPAENNPTYADFDLDNNTLNGGGLASSVQQSFSSALVCRVASGTNAVGGRFKNNILLGGKGTNRFGFFEDNAANTTAVETCHPQDYANNLIYFVPQVGAINVDHREWPSAGPQNLLTVTDVNAKTWADGNFTGDPLLDATWHLQPGSPAIDSGLATSSALIDFEGDARPTGNGFDVGADESK